MNIYMRALKEAYRSLPKNKTGRDIEVFPSDVMLVSYPRSGITWLRFLLGACKAPEKEIDFEKIRTLIPDIYDTPEETISAIEKPRVLKSHEYFDPRYKNVLHLVRDPRDVVVSYFYYLRDRHNKISANTNIATFVEMFINDEIDLYADWLSHYYSWKNLNNIQTKRYFLIRYEDLKDDTPKVLETVCDFIGLPSSQGVIESAVEKSNFLNMQKKHKNKVQVENSNSNFVRSGKVSSWMNELPFESQRLIEERFRPVMQELGYL